MKNIKNIKGKTMGWTTKATSSSEANFEVCEAGNHPAVCVGIIDIGTHNESFPGSAPKMTRKVFLCWEIPGEKKSDGTSHVMGREFTYSFHEKAGLRKMVESWRNKKFAEGEEFDLSKLIGQSCLLTVLNENSPKGKTFAKISGVSALPKGMAKPTPTIEPVTFNFEDNTADEFPDEDWLPWTFGQKLITKAMLSPEWKGKNVSNTSPETNAAADDEALPF